MNWRTANCIWFARPDGCLAKILEFVGSPDLSNSRSMLLFTLTIIVMASLAPFVNRATGADTVGQRCRPLPRPRQHASYARPVAPDRVLGG